MYEYYATYRSNYDGDTVRLDIDLGFGVILKDQVVRLLGIDAPEMRGDTLVAGRMSKLALEVARRACGVKAGCGSVQEVGCFVRPVGKRLWTDLRIDLPAATFNFLLDIDAALAAKEGE